MAKYKVGDKVRVKSLEWYRFYSDSNGNISQHDFKESMAEYCGIQTTVVGVTSSGRYRLEVDNGEHIWNESTIE